MKYKLALAPDRDNLLLPHVSVVVAGVIRVGREATNDLVIDDRVSANAAHVSRRHAELRACKDGVVVQDLGSQNGTYINGNRINGVGLAVVGDRVAFGTVSFYIQTD